MPGSRLPLQQTSPRPRRPSGSPVAFTSTPLRSSAIAQAGYDPDTRTMEVEFTSGRSYTHVDVPPEVYDALVRSSSPGRFYNDNIKGLY